MPLRHHLAFNSQFLHSRNDITIESQLTHIDMHYYVRASFALDRQG